MDLIYLVSIKFVIICVSFQYTSNTLPLLNGTLLTAHFCDEPSFACGVAVLSVMSKLRSLDRKFSI